MKKILSVFLLSLILGSPLANAGSPSVVGSWNVLFFLEPGRSIGSTQCIEFKSVPGTVAGVSSSGTWSSPSFPGWSGQWIQLGDHVRWFGITNSLATTESGDMENANAFGGVSFNHFSTSNAATSSAGSWRGARVSRCSQGLSTKGGLDPAI